MDAFLSLLFEKTKGLFQPPPHSCAVCYLVRFIEEHTEVREHHPKLLPPVAVLEFSEEISRQLVLKQMRRSQIKQ